MKASHRHLLTVVGAFGALALAGSADAQAVKAGPRVMVPVFAGPKPLGAQAADELRERLKNDYQVRTIWTVPKTDITGILEGSGFRTDTAVNNGDLKELARTARADEILTGRVTRTPSGVRVESWLVMPTDLAVAQPLPPVDAKNVGDAAKQISRQLGDARRQLDAYTKCQNTARAGNYAGAIAEANKGLGSYGNASLVRICRLQAYLAMKAPADTVLANANDVLRIDPMNKIALNAAGQAYSDKSDTLAAHGDKAQADAMNDKAVESWTKLISADPSDTRTLEAVVRKIVVAANPGVALPIIDTAVTQNPGNLQLLRLQWLIHLAAKDYRTAATIGTQMVQMDTSLADTTYYQRTAAAYVSLPDTAGAINVLGQATKKFPTNLDFLASLGQLYAKTGRTAEAIATYRQILTVNPKYPHLYLQMAQMYVDQQPDTALSYLRQAVQSGSDSASFVAQYALSVGNGRYKSANALPMGETAQNATKRAAMQQALGFLSFSDSLAASAPAKFLMGISYFTIGQLAATDAPKSKSCELAQTADNAITKAQIYLTQGGSTAPDAAKQYLNYAGQYAPVVNNQVKAFCKGSRSGGKGSGTR
ncbi:MAG: tetratricopeptide repeat protein [Gemmatimonadaceae bacterium]|nr:tetratricopeptide repeat protein [Gemmatimonadaceae bacterium]NUQ93513.1 tetratricopeptide repeat protein [Gemmatimonadaceae bacterium]NUR20022.1 tetratricopeptide repeat protein [Gemmatimonadaceae bacterium]NUS96353.1 tetratricopeptide repeat protein [Gemmatimonadaceae bacterium]